MNESARATPTIAAPARQARKKAFRIDKSKIPRGTIQIPNPSISTSLAVLVTATPRPPLPRVCWKKGMSSGSPTRLTSTHRACTASHRRCRWAAFSVQPMIIVT